MSSVPAEIAGIGATTQKLRVSPGFDPLKMAIGPEEYFVLSRIDGHQTLREVLLATGLEVDRAIAIVTKLRSIGALLLPGEGAPPAAKPAPPVANVPAKAPPPATTFDSPTRRPEPRSHPPTVPPSATRTTTVGGSRKIGTGELELSHDLQLPNPSAAEAAALAENVEISEPERRRILAMARLSDGRDPYALLGVMPGADAKVLKRAYFMLSKHIHPDRYYGKRLGSFADRMSLVFEATSRAYARLTSTDKTRASGSTPSLNQRPKDDQPQTPQEYAAELFERACHLEVSGDAPGAMKLFAAALRVDPQVRYLRRATSCAIAFGQPRTALEYAKKAHAQTPNDPSSARLLAAAFKAAGNLADAEEVLVMAMALKTENDSLFTELRNDLAEVRRMLGG